MHRLENRSKLWMRLLAAVVAVCGSGVAHAQLQWTATELRGEIPVDKEEWTGEYEAKNIGTYTISILGIDPVDNVRIGPGFKVQKIAPGEVIKLPVVVQQNGNYGEIPVKLWFNSSDETMRERMLTAVITRPRLLPLEPERVLWYKGEAPKPKQVKITVAPGQKLKITNAQNSAPEFWKVKMAEKVAGKEYVATITPSDTEAGRIGSITLTTDSPLDHLHNSAIFMAVSDDPAPAPDAGPAPTP